MNSQTITLLLLLVATFVLPAHTYARELVFLVGVADYQDPAFEDLKYCDDDVKALAETFRSKSYEVVTLLGEQATAKAIEDQFAQFLKQAKTLKEYGEAIVVFCGHGLQFSQMVNGGAVPKPYFCAYDADRRNRKNLLQLNEIADRLESESGCDRNLLIVDANRITPTNEETGVNMLAFARLRRRLNILLSCSPGERAYESDQIQHGAFAKVLLDGMRFRVPFEPNETKRPELLDYVRGAVPRRISEWVPNSPAMYPQMIGRLPAGKSFSFSPSYASKLDKRMTREIIDRLYYGKLLLLFLIDRTASMADERAEVRELIPDAYRAVKETALVESDELKFVISSFGNQFVDGQPLGKKDAVLAALDAVPADETGPEKTFSAIRDAIRSHRDQAQREKRQLMCVVVTDESGDPKDAADHLEEAIREAREARSPVYFLGREALFGMPTIPFTPEQDAELDRQVFFDTIVRGSDTAQPHVLQIDGWRRRSDMTPSGFLPYEQSRFARQTGGIAIRLKNPEPLFPSLVSSNYPLERMRPYLPDLASRGDQLKWDEADELHRTILKIVDDLNPSTEKNSGPQSVEVLVRLTLREIDLPAAVDKQLVVADRMLAIMSAAEKSLLDMKRLREECPMPRWRANYDLLLAELVTYQIRLEQYKVAIESFARNPGPVKNILGPRRPTTNWRVYVKQGENGPPSVEAIARAKSLLQKVIDEYGDSPYATRAKWELDRGWATGIREEHIPNRTKIPPI